MDEGSRYSCISVRLTNTLSLELAAGGVHWRTQTDSRLPLSAPYHGIRQANHPPPSLRCPMKGWRINKNMRHVHVNPIGESLPEEKNYFEQNLAKDRHVGGEGIDYLLC